MPTVTCTPGGASDNSYISEANANTYFADTLQELVWADYSDDQKQRALIQATTTLERLGGTKGDPDSPRRPKFSGSPYDTTTPQALHFPRTTDEDDDPNVVIPQDLADAVCEQAYWLLDRDTNPPLLDRRELQREGVRSVSVDGLSETWGVTSIPVGIAPKAWDRFGPFIRRALKTRV